MDASTNPATDIYLSENCLPAKTELKPLTDVQLGIWMADQIATDANAMTIAHRLTLSGDIDIAILAQSIHHVLSHSDTVAARYLMQPDDGQPGQLLGGQPVAETEIIDLSHQGIDAWPQADQIMNDDLKAPLRLDSGQALSRQILFSLPAHETPESDGAGTRCVVWYQRFHHIMLDGYSLNALTRAVAAQYQRHCAEINQASLPREAEHSTPGFTPFTQVISEQQRYKASTAYTRDQAFWRDYLSSPTSPTTLSDGDIGSTELASAQVIRQCTRISSATLNQLMHAAPSKANTQADIALALVFAYLYKITGQSVVTVRFPFMGRLGSKALNALGPVVNVLPLKIELNGQSDLGDLLSIIRKALQAVRRHQAYNAEQILRDLGPELCEYWVGAPTINLLLFDDDLHFNNQPAKVERLASGPIDDIDFALRFDASNGDLLVEWSANRHRYDAHTLALHSERLADFAERWAQNCQLPISQTTASTGRELANISRWQRSPYEDSPKPLADIVWQIFHRASARSDAPAIECSEGQLSHRQLTEQALQWARALSALGYQSGDRIGLALPRDARMVIATMALMRLRLTYVPMDPEYPQDRLAWMLSDAQPATVLTIQSLSGELPQGCPCLCVDDEAFISLVNEQSNQDWPEPEELDPLDTAYIMYTSGSTGKPKGVAIPYQGLGNLFYAHWVADYQPLLSKLNAPVRALHTASFSFDSCWDMLFWLIPGQQIFIVDEETRRDAQALVSFIRHHQLHTMDVPPSLLMQMLDAGLLDPGEHHPVNAWVGGEAASPALWARVREHTDFEMKNYYGPTENSVDSIGCSASDAEQVVIGRPLCQTQAYLLDEALQPVPVGVVGELYVAGPGLAHGYLNRAAQSASRFVANPFEHGERMYRTGDLARYLADGQIDFIGRSDHQVQIRGFRVEPGEVETVLAAQPGVTGALVIADTNGSVTRLLAYCTVPDVNDDNQASLCEQILAGAAQALPDYMVPSALKVLREFPLNVNGKVDRKALPAITLRARKGGMPAQNDQQALICRAIETCLGLDEVFADDDFFHLGGDSILAMSLANMLRQHGYQLRARDIFTGKTAQAMAMDLAAINTPVMSTQAPVASSAGVVSELPMLQWLNEHGGLTSDYLQAVLIRLPAKMTPALLSDALSALMRAHPVLGATVVDQQLHIPEQGDIADAVVSQAAVDPKLSFEEQAELGFEHLVERIDAKRGPLLQASWIQASRAGSQIENEADQRGAVIAIHHLAIDGISWRILLPELQQLGEALLRDAPITLQPEATPLRQWQQLLADQIEHYRAESGFWKQQLQAGHELDANGAVKASALDVKQHDSANHDSKDSASSMAGEQQARIRLSAKVTQQLLDSLPACYQCSAEEMLLAAITLALTEHFQCREIRYRLESHGRMPLPDQNGQPCDLARTVGWLTAEYPLRLALPDAFTQPVSPGAEQERTRTYEQLIRTVRSAKLAAGEQGLGYGVLRYLDPQSRHQFAKLEAENPPQVLVNYLGRFQQNSELWAPVPTATVFQDSFAVYQSEQIALSHAIELNMFVEPGEGDERLALQWQWRQQVGNLADIEAVTERIEQAAWALADYAKRNQSSARDTQVAADMALPASSDAVLDQLRNHYGAVQTVLPALPLQQGLLFHAQMESNEIRPSDAGYSTLVRLNLSGPVDVARLRGALAQVMLCHPQLGAVFDTTHFEQPMQILLAAPEPSKYADLWPFEFVDVSDLDRDAQYERIAEIEQSELSRPFAVFDGKGAPLVHATLIRCDDNAHALILNAHHLVMDGWSTPILLRDLLSAYAKPSAQREANANIYAAVVRALHRRDFAQMRQAWQQALYGAQPTLAFGEHPPMQAVTTYPLTLEPARFATLKQRCQAHGVTLNAVLQTLWAQVLSAMTGKLDVIFGTPVSGRLDPVAGINDQIGLFSNTVPVRVQLSPQTHLWDQIAKVQHEQGNLLEHDGLGLGEIQRLAGHSTLFDTLLVVENFPDADKLNSQDFHGLRLESVQPRGYTHYPLTILALPSEKLDILFEFRGDHVAMQTLMARFTGLLETLLAGDNPRVAELETLTESEQQLIAEVNQTDYPLEASTLRAQLHQQAQLTPDAVCLMDEQHSLCYRDCREQVVLLAKSLQDAGVKRGDIVAVALPRSVRLTLALWAVTEIGAAYLPLDTGYPDERLNLMLDDAVPAALITERGEMARFSSEITTIEFEALFESDSLIHRNTLANWQAPQLEPQDGAYLLYTSGSTGRPKGVLVSHQAIVNRLRWMQSSYPLDSSDTVLQKTPCSFDVSVWEFYWSAMVGARLMMAPPESHRDPLTIARLIDDHQITTLHFVPSMLAAFNAALESTSEGDLRLCPGLRRVFCSGEALPKDLCEAFSRRVGAPLHNLYGPTEAAVDVTAHPAFGAELDNVTGAHIPIGTPVWNTQLRILDNALRPTPIGVAGELYLCGVQLADGYYGRAALTAGRFVADPQGEGERMYRTGDVVRWLEDGSVEYLGRSDDQLKIRGQRIELGEIERLLAAQPGVAQCAVVAKAWGQATQTPGSDGRQLVGYVVAQTETTLDLDELRASLAVQLPAHMVPVVMLAMETLPLSANGKLDRNALPLPDSNELSGGREPAPGLETRLAASFAKVLGLDSVGADDDFFALGGHSLMAVQLVGELARSWQLKVSIGQIMVSPSVAQLARVLSDQRLANSRELSGFGSLLPIRAAAPHGDNAPLFCIHPASGFAWQYTGLSRYLDKRFGLVGLQSPRPDGPIASAANLNEMVERHLNLLREQQPNGPYRLLGYSLGGVIAHAMAVKLQECGETVSFLGLLDTYPPDDQDWSGPTDDEAHQEVEREKANFMQSAQTQVEAEQHQERDAMFADIVANYGDSIAHLKVARSGYFEGLATLFVATQTLPEGMDIKATWAPFVEQLNQHHFEYPHEDILSPQALIEVGPIINRLLQETVTASE